MNDQFRKDKFKDERDHQERLRLEAQGPQVPLTRIQALALDAELPAGFPPYPQVPLEPEEWENPEATGGFVESVEPLVIPHNSEPQGWTMGPAPFSISDPFPTTDWDFGDVVVIDSYVSPADLKNLFDRPAWKPRIPTRREWEALLDQEPLEPGTAEPADQEPMEPADREGL